MEFNLADLFEGVVDSVTQIDPDRLALVAGDVRLTYSELDARANRLAHYLIDAGVGPGDHVGIYSWNRAEWIESMLGVYKIRAVPININYRYVVDELAYIFDNADLVALVFERAFSPNVTATDLPSSLSRLIVIDDGSPEALPPGAVTYEEALEAFAPDRRGLGPRSPDDLYILYTGGTTGMPKGVMWRSEDIFFAALGGGNAAFPIAQAQDIAKNASGRGGTFVVTPPMMHGAAQWVALIALFSAGTVALYVGHTFDPEAVLDLAQSERAISILVVGDAMARPLAETIGAHPGRWDLSALLVIGSGGAILSEAIKNQLQNELPGVRILDSFGASETGHNGSVHDIDVTTGRPRFRVGPHTAVLGDDLLPVTPGSGQIGRLARRGNIPLAYYKDADKTAATFLIDPDGQRWVIPGDHASVDGDGHVLVLGRG
ncbi:MAG: AMP-binding protein, partial [Acidimicrobiales bacterium]